MKDKKYEIRIKMNIKTSKNFFFGNPTIHCNLVQVPQFFYGGWGGGGGSKGKK